MKLANAVLLLTLATAAAWAQVNAGEQKPEASLPFTMTTVTTFTLPWRLSRAQGRWISHLRPPSSRASLCSHPHHEVRQRCSRRAYAW